MTIAEWIDAFADYESDRMAERQRAHERAIRDEGFRAGDGVGYSRGYANGRHDGASELVRRAGEKALHDEIRFAAHRLADRFIQEAQRTMMQLADRNKAMDLRDAIRRNIAPAARAVVESALGQLLPSVKVAGDVPSYDPVHSEAESMRSTKVRLSIAPIHTQFVVMDRR